MALELSDAGWGPVVSPPEPLWLPWGAFSRARGPTLPSFTISDDGTHLLAVGMGDPQLGVSMWVSSDGVTWQPLPFSGATDAIPRWPGGTGSAFGTAYVVPGGLIVIGQQGSAMSESAWRVTALP